MVLQLVNLEGKEGTLGKDLTLEQWRALEPRSLDGISNEPNQIEEYRRFQIKTSWQFPHREDLEELSRFATRLQPDTASEEDIDNLFRYAHLIRPSTQHDEKVSDAATQTDSKYNPFNVLAGIRHDIFRGVVYEYSVDSMGNFAMPVLSFRLSEPKKPYTKRGKNESLDCVCRFDDFKSLEKFRDQLESAGSDLIDDSYFLKQRRAVNAGGFFPTRTGYMLNLPLDHLMVDYLKLGQLEFLTDARGSLQRVS